MTASDLPDRFWRKVGKNGAIPTHRPELGQCWLWTGSKTDKGYGLYNHRRVHRLVYMAVVGPVSFHFELDHLCRVRHCCNPVHLEPVTHKENVRRGDAMFVNGQRNARKSHCRRGHLYDAANTYRNAKNNKRICRKCQALNQKAYLVREQRADT